MDIVAPTATNGSHKLPETGKERLVTTMALGGTQETWSFLESRIIWLTSTSCPAFPATPGGRSVRAIPPNPMVVIAIFDLSISIGTFAGRQVCGLI